MALQLALALPCLTTVPRFFNDEAWEASLGHSLAFEGRLRHGFIEGWGGMHVHFVQNQVVLPLVTAALYRLAGFGIAVSRLASVLMSLAAVGCTYGAMRRWFGERTAFRIALAVIFQPWFFEISRRVRPEIYFVALAMGALWCWLAAAEQSSPVRAAAAGALAGLSSLAHPTGLVLCLSLAAGLAGYTPGGKQLRLAGAAAGGFLLAILPYVVYVVWAQAGGQVSFLEQMRGGRSVLTLGAARILSGEAMRWLSFFQWPAGAPLAAAMLAAWLTAWFRPGRPEKTLAVAVAVFAMTMPFATVNDTSRYLVGLTPLLAALFVRLVERVVGGRAAGSRRPLRMAVGTLLVLLYAATGAGAIGLMFHRLHGADFTRVAARIASVTGPKARVAGDLVFWMGRDRYNYCPFPLTADWVQTVEMVRPYRPEYAVRAAWRFSSSHGVAIPPTEMPPWRREKDRATDDLCRLYGTRVDTFRDPDFGPIEIYRLDWSRQTPATSAETLP